MLYHVALALELAVQSNVIITMKDAGDMKLLFIKYISDILIKIEDVIIWQLFFILEKKSNSCILDKSFKIIMRMARQMLNNELVRVTIFNSENNVI